MTVMIVLLMAGLVTSAVHCPDGTQCQERNTCCLTNTGYACCPYPSAVCCLDKAHCCPQDYRCDPETKNCVKNGVPWYRFPSSLQIPAEKPKKISLSPQAGVIRCSSRFYCPAGHTCCKAPTGQWGCCPYPLGQCCKDGKHCCEYGYDCDPTFSQCKKKNLLGVPARPHMKALLL